MPLPPAAIISLALSVPTFVPESLWDSWPSVRFVKTPAPCLRHAELVERIHTLESRHPGRLVVDRVGSSVQGRPIHLLTLGRGRRRLLLWSQMHGDEPSATPVLLDVADFLLSSPDPAARVVLDELTLLLLPMLNPDGAERYSRQNAQAIDVNRDALRLTTPEGRLLKDIRGRFKPELGFNLHDQNRRTTVGDTGRLATIALLAVAGDAEGTMTPGRSRAKRVCNAIARTLEALIPGGIARYDEDWNPRAFGDNLTAWGTPVVLLETGGLPPGWTYADLARLNFVALLTAVSGLARDDLKDEDEDVYENLPRNEDGLWVDVLVAGGRVWQPGSRTPYRADVAFDVLDRDPRKAGCSVPGPLGESRVREIGDGSLLGATRRVDATGRLVVPALAASLRGLDAKEWLDEAALAAIARLGVARLRWHVEPPELPEAQAIVDRLSRRGQPEIELAATGKDAYLLEVPARPSAPVSSSFAAALDALTGGSWRAPGRSLGDLLGPLVGAPPGVAAPPALSPDNPATLLLLQPQTEGTPEAGTLVLEAVFIDGREPATDR